jgi:hypothetical protein
MEENFQRGWEEDFDIQKVVFIKDCLSKSGGLGTS